MKAVITERGNGFPDIGDWIYDADTNTAYEIKALFSIHTGRAGEGNYRYADVIEAANGGDLSESEWDALSDCGIDLDIDE